MIYAWRYPNSVHRSAMIAVNPPGHFLWDPAATDELIHRYARLCANDASCGARTDDLVEVFQTTAADLPDRWMFLPIEPTHVRTASF